MEKTRSNKLDEDQQLLDRLLTEGSQALEHLYALYRPEFIAFARKYRAQEEDILDVYQDAIIAFFENVSNGKITKLTSTIKTYLFSIGKNKLIDRLKSYGRQVDIDSIQADDGIIENTFEQEQELTNRQEELRAAINELGGQCKDLLILFYYRRFSIEAIQKELAYKNENTVKANKSRCMKSLRSIIEKRGQLK